MKRIIIIVLAMVMGAAGFAHAGFFKGVFDTDTSSSEWTLSGTTITPTTATSTAAGYTSNVTTGVFQFGTQASEGMRYSPVTGGGRLGIGTTAPAGPLDLSQVGGDSTVPAWIRGSSSATNLLNISRGGVTFFEFEQNDATNPPTPVQFRPYSTGGATFMDLVGSAGTLVFDFRGSEIGGLSGGNNAGSPKLMIFSSGCTATKPGFSFYDDKNTGFTRSAADTPAITAGGETVYTATTTATSIGNTYSVNVDATNHALVVDQYGQVGQDPCSIEAKADLGTITDEQAAALFDQLRPFIGEYRKREPVFETKTVTDEDGKEKQVTSQTGWKYLEEGSGVIEPMMYASEMPLLNGKRLPYKDRAIIAILAAKIRVMEKTQADILNRLEKLEAK